MTGTQLLQSTRASLFGMAVAVISSSRSLQVPRVGSLASAEFFSYELAS